MIAYLLIIRSSREISAPVKTSYGYHILLGMELPEISDDIKNNYTYKLYIQPITDRYMNAYIN